MTTAPGTAGPLLVGLDVGTTSAKAAVFTAAGAQVAAGRAPTRWRRAPVPGPGSGAELDAADLAAAVTGAVGEALAGAPDGQVAALGVTGMGESGVLLDARGRAVAPVVAWHDDRDLAEVAELADLVGADALALATGLPLRRQWSLTKHRHALRHDPAARGAVRRLNVGEHAVTVLGGEEVSDASLASRTGWLHLPTRTWWGPGLAFSGLDEALLPPLVEPGTPCGRASAACGVDRLAGAVLTTAGHDHQAAALGAGAAGPGAVLDSSGTAEALVRTAAPGLSDAALLALTRAGVTVGWHVVPGAWCLLGATEGGLALQAALDAAGLASARAEDLAAAPPAALAAWRAAVEEVTAQAAALLAVVDAAAGPHTDLVVTGGWARSPDVLAAKRRLLGPLRTAGGTAEAGARGAALLAGRAAGLLAPDEAWPAGPGAGS